MGRFYVRDEERWESFAGTSHQIPGEAQVLKVPNGVLLPLKKDERASRKKKLREGVFKGGVCDAEMNFVAGRQRHLKKKGSNFDCTEAYKVDSDAISYRDETVVFAGIVVGHFGHMLLDFASRLWYIARHPDCGRIVCLRYPESEYRASYDGLQILDFMGIARDRVEIIDRPTRFREVIVPEETMLPLYGYKAEYIDTFRLITGRINKGNVEKLYLSRQNFSKSSQASIINEEYFENFFVKRGFVSVCPEKLSLEEQISLVAGAEEIVTTMGSMAHLLLFARPDVKAIILNRTACIKPQIYVDQAAHVEPVYIDANSNPLPVAHNTGPFLLMPNRHFRRYVEENDLECSEGEMKISELEKASLLYSFYVKWAENFSNNPAYRKKISKKSMKDVISLAHDFVEDEDSQCSVYEDADALSSEIVSLKKRVGVLTRQLNAVYSSRSWKITAPLRAMCRKGKKR